jgi:hypothetical protein
VRKNIVQRMHATLGVRLGLGYCFSAGFEFKCAISKLNSMALEDSKNPVHHVMLPPPPLEFVGMHLMLQHMCQCARGHQYLTLSTHHFTNLHQVKCAPTQSMATNCSLTRLIRCLVGGPFPNTLFTQPLQRTPTIAARLCKKKANY